MKQIAKLAQAIVHGPRLLLLDEPTNGLDPAARERMLRLIREIRDAGETRIVISSHLLHDVEECCDEVLILKEGRVAAVCDLEAERRTNRKFLDLETAGGNGSFVEAVTALGCECAVFDRADGGRRIKLVLPEGVEIRTLFRLAAERDVEIRRLSYRRDSLEDIFLSAMRGGTHRQRPAKGRRPLAVHRRRFQAYEGPLTPLSTRFAVVVRYALRDLFESRVFLMLFIAACVPLIAGIAQVYLNHNPTARALLHMRPDLFAINNVFFFRVISVQSVLAIVLAAWVGPVLVAPDLAGGALPLYLSRPLSRPQYLLGKMGTILGLLSLVTWIPALALFALEAGLTGGSWFWDNGWIARAVVLGAGMWIALLAFMVVTCSVWVRWRLAATGLFIGVFAVGETSGRVLGHMFESNWGRLLDINYLVTTVWWDLFHLSRPTPRMLGAKAAELPWWAAWVALTVICAVCLLILDRRLRAREVVR